jgi:hypothetical protein
LGYRSFLCIRAATGAVASVFLPDVALCGIWRKAVLFFFIAGIGADSASVASVAVGIFMLAATSGSITVILAVAPNTVVAIHCRGPIGPVVFVH